MGSEFLTETPSPSVKTYTEQFHEVFPSYLTMGMTYELFWLEDSTLVRDYRKAYKMIRERANYDAWLQGGYFYDALCAVSPVLHAFAKHGTKPAPYCKEPYAMQQRNKVESAVKEQEGAAMFLSFATRFNKRFEQGGDKNG